MSPRRDGDLRILGVIPARGGSKGVPRKNLRRVGGASLVERAVRTGREVRDLVHRTVVSTDDPEVARAARKAGGDVPFMRPSRLADDCAPMAPVARHALEFAEAEDGARMDWVLLLQPTSPLRAPQDVEGAVAVAKRGECDSVISVVRVHAVHPVLMKRVEDGYLRPFCVPEREGTRRQDYRPAAYMRNGAVYLVRRDVLLGGSLWGDRIRPYEMPEHRSVCVDSELDLRLADLLAREHEGRPQPDGRRQPDESRPPNGRPPPIDRPAAS